jgi:hypothetical protein
VQPNGVIGNVTQAAKPHCHDGRISCHDTQECCSAGLHRNDSNDGSFAVGVRSHFSQCAAGLASGGHAVLIIHLCVWLLQCGRVLLHISPGAVAGHLLRLKQNTTFVITATTCKFLPHVSDISAYSVSSTHSIERQFG